MVVVVVDIEDDVLGGCSLFFFEHPQIGLVDGPASDTEIMHRLLEMRRQVLLPGLVVTDLMALCEAVAVGVDAAGMIGVIA